MINVAFTGKLLHIIPTWCRVGNGLETVLNLIVWIIKYCDIYVSLLTYSTTQFKVVFGGELDKMWKNYQGKTLVVTHRNGVYCTPNI